jgi:hypothetical protein
MSPGASYPPPISADQIAAAERDEVLLSPRHPVLLAPLRSALRRRRVQFLGLFTAGSLEHDPTGSRQVPVLRPAEVDVLVYAMSASKNTPTSPMMAAVISPPSVAGKVGHLAAGKLETVVGDPDQLSEVKWASLPDAVESAPGMFPPGARTAGTELHQTLRPPRFDRPAATSLGTEGRSPGPAGGRSRCRTPGRKAGALPLSYAPVTSERPGSAGRLPGGPRCCAARSATAWLTAIRLRRRASLASMVGPWTPSMRARSKWIAPM